MENRRNLKLVKYSQLVREFMQTSGQVTNTQPTALSLDNAALRHSLFQEEVQELADAVEACDRVEILDALADILVIAVGTSVAMGDEDIEDELYMGMKVAHRVDPENQHLNRRWVVEKGIGVMQDQGTRGQVKSFSIVFVVGRVLGFDPNTIAEAFDRVMASNMTKFCRTERIANATVLHYKKEGVETFWSKVGDLYVVYRTSDKKVLKSIVYEPVSLGDLIN